MDGQSHTPDGGRERYERVARAAAELAQLLMTLKTLATLSRLDMSGLVVENITTLVIDDAAALAVRAPWVSRRRRSASIRLRLDLATRPPQPGDEFVREVARIDDDAAKTSSNLMHTISAARQACDALARAGGPVDLSLLYAIAVALSRISACYNTLGQLAHDRTRAMSSLRASRTVPSPRATPAVASPRADIQIDLPGGVTRLDEAHERRIRPAPRPNPLTR